MSECRLGLGFQPDLPGQTWSETSERCQDGRSRCRAVRRLLIAAAVLLAGSAHAQVDQKVMKQCMNAKDFAGCVQVLSGSQTTLKNDLCVNLRKGLAIVRERLVSGTTLSELDTNTNPLSDPLAIAKAEGGSKLGCQQLILDSQTVLEMIRVLSNQWQTEIDIGQDSRRWTKIYPSPPIIQNINLINMLAGGTGTAITGPGEIRGLRDTRRQGYDYELREWRGSMMMPCVDSIKSESWCGNYIVVSPKSRMLTVIRVKIDSALSGLQPDWTKRD